MQLPTVIVNFKTYESATGDNALELAKVHDKVARETGISFAICVQATDLYRITQEVSIPVFAQHVDPITYGSHTGSILPEVVKQAGAYGTLLNHAEHQLEFDVIASSIARAKDVGLTTCVCANTPEVAAKIAEFNPDFIAVEPPELIGGDISISSAKPEVVTKAVSLVGDIKLLVGAGVKNSQDTKKAIQLGASGVLLASGVTKANNPYEILTDLAKGLM
ncbi:triose-phosphate isomerase [bacterium]|nr:triose-phosphate isomerase [bacterium]